jgi:hypothetical protein
LVIHEALNDCSRNNQQWGSNENKMEIGTEGLASETNTIVSWTHFSLCSVGAFTWIEQRQYCEERRQDFGSREGSWKNNRKKGELSTRVDMGTDSLPIEALTAEAERREEFMEAEEEDTDEGASKSARRRRPQKQTADERAMGPANKGFEGCEGSRAPYEEEAGSEGKFSSDTSWWGRNWDLGKVLTKALIKAWVEVLVEVSVKTLVEGLEEDLEEGPARTPVRAPPEASFYPFLPILA